MQSEMPDKEPSCVTETELEQVSPTATAKRASGTASSVLRVINGGVRDDGPAMDTLDRIALRDDGVGELVHDCKVNAIDLSWIRTELDGSAALPEVFFKLLTIYLEYLIKILDLKIRGGSNVTVLQISNMRRAAQEVIASIPAGKEKEAKLRLKILKRKTGQLQSR